MLFCATGFSCEQRFGVGMGGSQEPLLLVWCR